MTRFEEALERAKQLALEYNDVCGMLIIAVEDDTRTTSVCGTFCVPCACDILHEIINEEKITHGHNEERKVH